jgi:ABC-2 type transport system permease protein
MGRPLPFGQSLLLIWPHITAFVAGIILLFVLAYVKFQRIEIRA